MKIHVDLDQTGPCIEAKVGNVYPRRGGRGSATGEMVLLFAIHENKKTGSIRAIVLILDREGEVIGADRYNLSYWEDKCPIAFVDGLEDIDLTMRSL